MAKCDFLDWDWRDEVELVLRASDWRVRVGALAAHGTPQQLRALETRTPTRSLRIASDKCDFRVQMSAIANKAVKAPTVGASLQSAKCDFAVFLAGSMAKRQALTRIATRMGSDKCDFLVNLQFGPERAPMVRVAAVASDKCDFQLRSVEIREASGNWKTLSLGEGGAKPKK